METLDYGLLRSVQQGFNHKNAFVPMPGGQTEPVAGASQATAAMGSPMGAPQGGASQGGAPQDPQQPGGGGLPPEMAQILQDPQVQQVLQQNGLSVDPASGNVMDQQSGQMLPPDQVQQILQELMQQQGGGGAPGGEGQTPQDSGGGGQASGQDPSQGAPQEQDPLTAILGKLDEILAAIKGGAPAAGGAAPAPEGGAPAPEGGAPAAGGAAPAQKKPSQSEKTDMMLSEIQRMNETLASLTGQQ